VDVRDSLNREYYGKEVSPVDIIIKNEVSNEGSEELRAALKKWLNSHKRCTKGQPNTCGGKRIGGISEACYKILSRS